MNLFLRLLCPISYFACSCSPRLVNKQYTTVAWLNDSTWFGRASAAEVNVPKAKSYADRKITVFLSTALGYPGDRVRLSADQVAAQAGEFVPRQRLTFYNVPAKRGKYRLLDLNQCDDMANRQGNFVLLLSGSGVVESFFAQTRRSGWVRLDAIDPVARTVSGRFNVTLISRAGRIAAFKRGRFSAAIPRSEQ